MAFDQQGQSAQAPAWLLFDNGKVRGRDAGGSRPQVQDGPKCKGSDASWPHTWRRHGGRQAGRVQPNPGVLTSSRPPPAGPGRPRRGCRCRSRGAAEGEGQAGRGPGGLLGGALGLAIEASARGRASPDAESARIAGFSSRTGSAARPTQLQAPSPRPSIVPASRISVQGSTTCTNLQSGDAVRTSGCRLQLNRRVAAMTVQPLAASARGGRRR